MLLLATVVHGLFYDFPSRLTRTDQQVLKPLLSTAKSLINPNGVLLVLHDLLISITQDRDGAD